MYFLYTSLLYITVYHYYISLYIYIYIIIIYYHISWLYIMIYHDILYSFPRFPITFATWSSPPRKLQPPSFSRSIWNFMYSGVQSTPNFFSVKSPKARETSRMPLMRPFSTAPPDLSRKTVDFTRNWMNVGVKLTVCYGNHHSSRSRGKSSLLINGPSKS